MSQPPYPPPSPVPYPPPPVMLRPVRIDPVPGTAFGVAYLGVSPTLAGLAVGSVVAGIGSILVCTVVFCFGTLGAQQGWGALVAGAFAVLAALTGAAGIGTGLVALRQIRRAPTELRGRGLALTGVACGCAGVLLTLLGFLLAVALLRPGG